ncbi:hypothetical protein GCM10009601_56740 [Streptomyces thermospinosisporus]|uniref:Uncharacterized protein n=1 Tax=Streptomyces thermospinosisporus TaxID=161482 RepID=A0ABN1Z723_9ACTN
MRSHRRRAPPRPEPPAAPDHRPDVFVWDHETDSRLWTAPDLKTYLHHALTGDDHWWCRPPV